MHRPTLTQRGERQAIGWGAIGGFRAFARAHRLSFDLEWPKRKGGKGIMRNSRDNSLRLSAVAAAGALALVCFTAADAQQAVSPKLTTVDRAMMPSAAQIQNWLDQKDSWGPAYTAGPGWKKFMAMLHAEMKSMGMVNVGDYPYPYTRWYTSEFPDKSGWSLPSNGPTVDVAPHRTPSGSTAPSAV